MGAIEHRLRGCPTCQAAIDGVNVWHEGDCPDRNRQGLTVEVVRASELRGAVSMVEALTQAARGTSSAGGVYCKLCSGFDAQAWEDLTHSCPLGGQS